MKKKPYPSTLPPMPKGQVYLGKGGTFKVPDDGFFGLYLDPAATRWPRYSHSCSGEDRTGHYCAPAGSEVARLNGLTPAKKAPRKAAKKAVKRITDKALSPIEKLISEEKAKTTPPLVLEVGKTYLTRGGQTARVLCVDFKNANNQSVVAAVTRSHGFEFLGVFQQNGRYAIADVDNADDIISLAPDFNWSCLPPWINMITMDQDGAWWGYEKMPEMIRTAWVKSGEGGVSCHIHPQYTPTSTPTDWRQSLRVRPGYNPSESTK